MLNVRTIFFEIEFCNLDSQHCVQCTLLGTRAWTRVRRRVEPEAREWA